MNHNASSLEKINKINKQDAINKQALIQKI